MQKNRFSFGYKISLRLHIAYKHKACLCMEILKKQSVDPLRKFGNLWLFWRLNVSTGVLPLYLDRITDNRFFHGQEEGTVHNFIRSVLSKFLSLPTCFNR